MKLSRKEIDDELAYDWELIFGTDCIDWFEEYQMYLPYWVEYMNDEVEKQNYIARIQKGEFDSFYCRDKW